MTQSTEGAPENHPAPPPEHQATRRVLLVDDNEIDAEIVRALIRRMPDLGWELHWASSFDEGLSTLAAQPVDIVLVDYWLGAYTGAEFIREARSSGHSLPMVVVTAIADPSTDWRVFLAGAAAYVPKDDLTCEVLERTIRYALRDPQGPHPYALNGLACICIDCRRLRDSQERWSNAEDYLASEPAVTLSHGLCPQCFQVRIAQSSLTDPRGPG